MAVAPSNRIHTPHPRPVRGDGDYVLYWMVAARRPHDNWALEHAVARAKELGKPLVVFEPLRRAYPWASERFHTFVLEGMEVNGMAFAEAGVRYLPYVEPEEDADKGLIAALAEKAALVVTDAYPTYFLPRMVAAAAAAIPRRFEVVDSLGLIPLAATPKGFARAHDFRRWIQKNARPFLKAFPAADPLADYDQGLAQLPDLSRWIGPDGQDVRLDVGGPGASPLVGGWVAAEARFRRWLRDGLTAYADGRNHPDDDAASGLSPYLHFGHIGIHGVLRALFARDDWSPDRLAPQATGKREGWWGCSPEVEAFLDEAVTWREVGHVFAHHVADHDRYESLPDWARLTLDEHRADARHVYSLDALEQARTDDDIWNAAQRQLVRTGVMNNYLRMLWGKKVLQWSASPEEALDRLIHLNNTYALDGRDPNSYSGIFWCFGRFDRAWGPERPIFGKVRYMTSDSTRKKLRLSEYLSRWS